MKAAENTSELQNFNEPTEADNLFSLDKTPIVLQTENTDFSQRSDEFFKAYETEITPIVNLLAEHGEYENYSPQEFITELKTLYKIVTIDDMEDVARQIIDSTKGDSIHLHLDPEEKAELLTMLTDADHIPSNSNVFVASVLSELAKRQGKTVVPITNEDIFISSNEPIVFLDDCAYLGNQVEGKVKDYMSDQLEDENGTLHPTYDQQNPNHASPVIIAFGGITQSTNNHLKNVLKEGIYQSTPITVLSTKTIPVFEEMVSEKFKKTFLAYLMSVGEVDSLRYDQLRNLDEKHLRQHLSWLYDKPVCITDFKIPDYRSLNRVFTKINGATLLPSSQKRYLSLNEFRELHQEKN